MLPATDLVRFARTELAPLLIEVRASPTALAEVAARSYPHDNGFVKIVLARGRDEGEALRLHVWPAHTNEDGNVHNHCWDFTSLVLAGELAFEEFAVDLAGGFPAQHFAYVQASDFEYGLRPLGDTRLLQTSSGVRSCGELYDMAGDTLHRTWGQRDATTITLLAQGPRRRKHADVYVTRSGDVPARTSNAALNPRELRSHLSCVLELLETAPLPSSRRAHATPHGLLPRGRHATQ